MALKILTAILADHEELGLRVLLQQTVGFLQHVLVVGSGQSLVSGDDQKAIGSVRRKLSLVRVQIPALHMAGGAEDPLDLRLQRLKIRAGLIPFLLGLAQLGRRDQVHGVSDLPGLLDAVHPDADLTGAWHGSSLLCRRRVKCA